VPWSLEHPGVEALLEKIRRAGVPLKEFIGISPYYGIKTGFNEAFLIDTPTKERLVREDPRSVEIIKPYLRGQDIQRWDPRWTGLWMIVMRSSENHEWPWAGFEEAKAERAFRDTYPSIYSHLKPFEERLRKRSDSGRYWWELRSCAYYDLFDQPKIYYPDITWTSQFALDQEGYISNNTVYFLPTDSRWLLAVLNSPLMWHYCWKTAVHGKDEALRFFGDLVEALPVATPPAAIRSETESDVERLVAMAKNRQIATRQLLDWLQVEFGVTTPGKRLSAPHDLDPETFIAEVKKRRAGGASLTSADLKRLRAEYSETIQPLREEIEAAERLEHAISDAVNAAYGLTPEEVAVLWETAPPRMPLKPLAGAEIG
jgi:hypothetical protein